MEVTGVPNVDDNDLTNNRAKGVVTFLDGNGGYKGLESGDRFTLPRNNVDGNVYSYVATTSLTSNSVTGSFNSITLNYVAMDDCADGTATWDVANGKSLSLLLCLCIWILNRYSHLIRSS